ncbi:MAG: radical SAM protein [Deltaproteobacteria bacterium]|jgi:formate C-acetyltransferase|nr:radical SAM protein [Deltaproteobacteria bacterium]MBW2531599.1 radical SAM protein [Deltaproteobacteria bacterium]
MTTAALLPTTEAGDEQLDVLSIQRTCVHDGPGLRTLVFFRGCAMRCTWCHNPETQSRHTRLLGGERTTVAAIMDVIERDRPYYRRSHGGVTLSGGEPLLQPRAGLLALLSRLEQEELHVTVETAGLVPWSAFQAVQPYVSLFLFDLKLVGDDERHRELTGVRFGPIAENARRLVAAGADIRFRMCVVPGLNDHDRDIEAAAAFLRELGQSSIELLRYYDMHETKARRLRLVQEPLSISAEQSAEALERVTKAFVSLGIAVRHTGAPLERGERRTAEHTERVLQIKQEIRDAGYHACVESAELKTAFYQKHGFQQPAIVQRGELLRYLLNNKRVIIYPRELLVGNYTAKRVGGNLWSEYFGAIGALTVWNLDRQKPVPFQISLEDKANCYAYLPFWTKHGLIADVFPSAKELALFSARMLEKKVAFHNNMAGVAHFIVNTERILELGTEGIRAEIEAKQAESDRGADFYEGVKLALTALEQFAARYAKHLREHANIEKDPSRQAELRKMATVCDHVPKRPARTFHEALQSILFVHIGVCAETFENAISFGRLDQVLHPYYLQDVADGALDYESARELLACFILKIDELIFVHDGDAGLQFGKLFESLSPVETVTFGGVDEEGNDCTNDLSYMLLDICELRPISVNMAARIHPNSPDRYVERIAEVYLSGSPMPALFNDEPYVAALQKEYDAPLADARNYSIVGCVEPVASRDHFANTDCANLNITLPFLQALQGDQRPLWKHGVVGGLGGKAKRWMRTKLGRQAANGNGSSGSPPESMAELMQRFQKRTDEAAAAVLYDHGLIEDALRRKLPTPLASALFEGCIESGQCVYEGGASINSSGIQAVGITDVADSLCAIEKVVFEEKRFTLEQVIDAMDANFEGEEHQRVHEALLAAPKFGDDGEPRTVHWMNRVLEVYVTALRGVKHEPRGGKYVAGYYGLNTNLVYGKKTPALPSGRRLGTPLANSLCPHYGRQAEDLTSALNAVAQLDFASYAPNGTTLTSTVDAGLFPGEEGVKNLASLIRGYCDQGGMQFQPNVISREILLDAYHHPGKHKDLVVRIAGYCAYFDDLSDDLKLEIINRSYYTDGER